MTKPTTSFSKSLHVGYILAKANARLIQLRSTKKFKMAVIILLIASVIITIGAVAYFLWHSYTIAHRLKIISITPINGQQEITASSQIDIKFEQAVDVNTLGEDGVVIICGDSRVEGKLTYDAIYKTLTFIPKDALQLSPSDEEKPLLQYHIRVSGYVKSIKGEPLYEDYNSTFFTKRLTATSVINNSANGLAPHTADLKQNITLAFSKPLNQESLNPGNMYIVEGELIIPTTIKLEQEASLTIEPRDNLKFSTTYTLHISRNFTAGDGSTLDREYSFDFSTVGFDTISNLILHYPFDGNAEDQVWQNDGQVFNAIPTVDRNGKANGALAFQEGAWLTAPQVKELSKPNWSISLWLKPEDNMPAYEPIFRNNDNYWESKYTAPCYFHPVPLYLYVELYRAADKGSFYIASQMMSEPLKGKLTIGAWVHVALVNDNGITTLYVNGVSVGSAQSVTCEPKDIVNSYLFGQYPDWNILNRFET